MKAALALLALLTLAALLQSCGRDDDGADTPGASSPPSSATAVTATATPSVRPTATGPSAGSPGVHNETIFSGGIERTYRLYVPEGLPPGPVPLVVALHGGFGSGEQLARTSRFDQKADEGGFIVAYPNGTGTVPTWNGGRCCGFAARENIDDEEFMEDLIDAIAAKYPVDGRRVYAVGHSNGGIMALRLACQVAHRFAAVGAVAGSLEVPEEGCFPTAPVSVLLIHGDADQSHPLEGGQGPNSVAGVDFNSVAATMESMRKVMGCSTETTVTTVGAVTTTEWLGCANGVSVQQQIIAGGSHAWPGGARGPGLGGEPTDAMDATAALWDFLRTKSR